MPSRKARYQHITMKHKSNILHWTQSRAAIPEIVVTKSSAIWPRTTNFKALTITKITGLQSNLQRYWKLMLMLHSLKSNRLPVISGYWEVPQIRRALRLWWDHMSNISTLIRIKPCRIRGQSFPYPQAMVNTEMPHSSAKELPSLLLGREAAPPWICRMANTKT